MDFGLRLLSDEPRDLIYPSDKLIDFHAIAFVLTAVLNASKYLKSNWNTNTFVIHIQQNILHH